MVSIYIYIYLCLTSYNKLNNLKMSPFVLSRNCLQLLYAVINCKQTFPVQNHSHKLTYNSEVGESYLIT